MAALWFVLLVLMTATFFIVANRLLGPKPKRSSVKDDLFECGVEPIAPPPTRYPVRFYRLAIVFVLLDIELAFFLPWAVVAREVGWPGYALMTFFTFVLVIGLIYFFRHRGLEFWAEPEEEPAIPRAAVAASTRSETDRSLS